MDQQRVLVTGARGFVGQSLVRTLLELGSEVVCLDRTAPIVSDALTNLPVQRVTADLRDARALDPLFERVGTVFHLAASTSPRSLLEARQVNVQGTKNLAAAAARQSAPPTFVFVSSLAAAGPHADAVVESMTCRPVSTYGRTKLEAEQALRHWSSEIPITIVRPPGVFGPGDRNLLALFKSVCRGWNVCANPAFRYSLLHVDDLAVSLVAAARRGRRLPAEPDLERQGLYYVADPQAVTMRELGERIAKCLNRASVHTLRVPRVCGWVAAVAGELAQRGLRRRVYFNWDKAREAYGGSWVCDPGRAYRELQAEPAASLETRLAETATAYRQAGWLSAGVAEDERSVAPDSSTHDPRTVR